MDKHPKLCRQTYCLATDATSRCLRCVANAEQRNTSPTTSAMSERYLTESSCARGNPNVPNLDSLSISEKGRRGPQDRRGNPNMPIWDSLDVSGKEESPARSLEALIRSMNCNTIVEITRLIFNILYGVAIIVSSVPVQSHSL